MQLFSHGPSESNLFFWCFNFGTDPAQKRIRYPSKNRTVQRNLTLQVNLRFLSYLSILLGRNRTNLIQHDFVLLERIWEWDIAGVPSASCLKLSREYYNFLKRHLRKWFMCLRSRFRNNQQTVLGWFHIDFLLSLRITPEWNFLQLNSTQCRFSCIYDHSPKTRYGA